MGRTAATSDMVLQDGDFSESRFRDIVNAYLANSVGNLLNRTQGLLKKNCNGTLPVASSSIPADNPLRAVAAEQVSRGHLSHVGEGFTLTALLICATAIHIVVLARLELTCLLFPYV